MSIETPESVVPHEAKYRSDAWHEYTPEELLSWVLLLTKRAGMRTDREKHDKDLADARNYRDMLNAAIDARIRAAR